MVKSCSLRMIMVAFRELKATFSLKLALKVEHSSARPMDLTTFREYRL